MKSPQQIEAERLTALTGGAVRIEFNPRAMLLHDDPASLGHVYMGHPPVEVREDFLDLDDRKPEPLHAQLAAELRRAAAWYAGLAERVEATQA
jgi:hypothetical protein